MDKLALVGSYYGTKKIKKYKEYDIDYSIVDNHNCKINKLYFTKNNDGTYYIYHMYDNFDNNNKIDFTGRWYNVKFNIDENMLDVNNKLLKVSFKNVEWETENTYEKKNVRIQIQLTDDGIKKLLKFIE